MTAEGRADAIDAELRAASRAFREAEVLMEAGLVAGGLSRLYFAALHWARALLASDGIEPKTHRGTKSLLSQHFVRPGRLEVEHAQTLARLETWRDDADYDSNFVEDPVLLQREWEATQRFRDRALALINVRRPQ